MHRINSTGNAGSGYYVARRNRRLLCLGATLLTCLSCSSDPTLPGDNGGNAGQAQAGLGNAAGAGSLGGAAGHAGKGGSAANSGSAGDDQSAGGTTTAGSATAGISGSSDTAGCAGTAATGGTAGNAAGGTPGNAGNAASGTPGNGGDAAGGTPGSAGDATGGTAGNAATGGAAGNAATGGTAGNAATGGTGDNAGSAGIAGAAATGGNAGTAGTVATGGSSAGVGGIGGTTSVGGTGGAQQGSFTLSDTMLHFGGICTLTAQLLTISNTSSVALTWQATTSLTTTQVSPAGSTLAPGEAIAVSVLPAPFPIGSSTLLINADIAPSQSVELRAYPIGHKPPPLPPDIDFGNVVMGFSKSAFVGVYYASYSPKLSIFEAATDIRIESGVSASSQPGGFGWTVRFSPKTLGPQQNTLTFFSATSGTVCPPNTFTARGVGVAQ